MMIDYGAFRFAGPPRTATTWFRKAAAAVGLGEKSSVGVHTPHTPRGAVLALSTVRHPVNWLSSYYNVLDGGLIGVSAVDRFAPLVRRSRSLGEFVDLYLSSCPGTVGEMFWSYNADSVLRIEDLPWAAVEFFGAENLHVDVRKLKQNLEVVAGMPPHNVSTGVIAVISPKMRQRVLDAESNFCNLYGY